MDDNDFEKMGRALVGFGLNAEAEVKRLKWELWADAHGFDSYDEYQQMVAELGPIGQYLFELVDGTKKMLQKAIVNKRSAAPATGDAEGSEGGDE